MKPKRRRRPDLRRLPSHRSLSIASISTGAEAPSDERVAWLAFDDRLRVVRLRVDASTDDRESRVLAVVANELEPADIVEWAAETRGLRCDAPVEPGEQLVAGEVGKDVALGEHEGRRTYAADGPACNDGLAFPGLCGCRVPPDLGRECGRVAEMPMTLTAFHAKHGVQQPRKRPDNPDQLRLLSAADGVILLKKAPFPVPVAGPPGFPEGKHLWVIRPADLPVILETAPDVQPPPLQSGCAKHTNLTGGAPACCGGELWVDAVTASRLYVNGGSGRYQPRTPAELEDAVEVFESLGFQVESMGWDDDSNTPARTLRPL